MEEKDAPKIVLPGQADPQTRRARLFSSRDLRAQPSVGNRPAHRFGTFNWLFHRPQQGYWRALDFDFAGCGLGCGGNIGCALCEHELHIMNKEEERKRKEAEAKKLEEERHERHVTRRY